MAAAWPLERVMLSASKPAHEGCKCKTARISQQEKLAPIQPCSALLMQDSAFTRSAAHTAAQLFWSAAARMASAGTTNSARCLRCNVGKSRVTNDMMQHRQQSARVFLNNCGSAAVARGWKVGQLDGVGVA